MRNAAAHLRNFWYGLADLVYPAHCFLCGRQLPGELGVLCPECRERSLDRTARRCPRCAGVLGRDALESGCPECRRTPRFRWRRAAVVGAYEEELRELMLDFKYRRALAVGRDLARELARAAESVDLELASPVVVAVPLHWWKRLKRGFNQAEALAEEVAANLARPHLRGALVAVRPTGDQIGLSRAERRRNVEGAFRARKPERLRGRDVLLVDDVFTTGATLNECTRVLKKAGARRVSVAAVARARTG